MSALQIEVIVPCFNEAARLDPKAFARFAGRARLLFVDDGSTDETPAVLETLRARSAGEVDVLTLPENRGKAEAVRAGFLRAIERGASVVGLLDADLSTPPEEMLRLIERMDAEVDVLLGARVALMGRRIERRAWRHYLGRVFATAASIVVAQPIYDTQCGAKLFRVTPLLAAVLEEPFRSSWIFDVELLGRMLVGMPGVGALAPARLKEEPLECWIDVEGSKVGATAFARAPLELTRIALALAARRKRNPPNHD
jgi:dolichyl-phosphate beta-glucosyltransferase